MTTIPDDPAPLHTVTPATSEERRAASLAVCDWASGAVEAGELLDMLGLREVAA